MTKSGGFEPHAIEYITDKHPAKKSDQRDQEIWQVVIRKLRVWAASSEGGEDDAGAIPCRPYCIMVNNSYPKGQVITRQLCSPPEKYPDAKTVLDIVLNVMVNPPDKHDLAHRLVQWSASLPSYSFFMHPLSALSAGLIGWYFLTRIWPLHFTTACATLVSNAHICLKARV